jgi:cell division ATPase FtsA
MTVNAKEICNRVIPLPLRIADPPKLGGIVDDIINPAYTSTIGLLIHNKNTKKSSGQSVKTSKVSIGGFISKIKSLLEPLLP